MQELNNLPPLRDVISAFDLRAHKSLGQHFLCDLNLTRKIAELAGDLSECAVLEVGPGPGGLTRALVESAARKITAVEKDPRCVAALTEVVAAAKGKLELIQGDALKIDFSEMQKAPRAIVANLPYNVGTELLIGWIKKMEDFRSITVMLQSEVVDRLRATPNSKEYGRLSVIAQFRCNVQKVLDVPAAAFSPPPKVDSAVVRLTQRNNAPTNVSFEAMEKVTAFAFGQRRKMLRSSLKPLGGEEMLRSIGIDPQRRAETLSLEEFERIAALVSSTTR